MVLLNIKSQLLTVFAWGDNSEDGRPSYTIEEINHGAIGPTEKSHGKDYKNSPDYPGQIIFNTISDSVMGDEKNFVGARQCTIREDGRANPADPEKKEWRGNDITALDGQYYIIRLYVHNNNPNGFDAVAEDTKVSFAIPDVSATSIEVNGLISSSNAIPSEYWDYINFNSTDDTPFHLEYIQGSALLENNGIGLGGVTLSDNIVNAKSGGTLIGYDALDGKIPGCYEYDSVVTILVKAVYDYDSIKRPTYSLQQVSEGVLGNTITFNSIKVADSDYEWHKVATGNDIARGTIRNETNFVGAREDTGINAGSSNVWEGTEIAAEDGKTYIVRLYAHNNNPNGFNAVAENTKVRFFIPYESASTQKVRGWLQSSNATPNQYLDSVVFKSTDGTPFHLEYVSGSALLENGGFAKGAGVQLPDSITNQGNPTNQVEDEWTLIGYEALDGKVPGCYEYTNYVTIEVKVVYDYEFTVETKVRLADNEDKTWKETVEAKIGDKVEFQFQYRNTGSQNQKNVVVRDVLPSNLRYVKGTAKLYNGNHPNGMAIDNDEVIFDKGGRIGSYDPNANAFIRITAEVVDDNLAYGSNALYNWGQAGVGNTVNQDYATVVVYNDKVFKIITLGLIILILICIVAIIHLKVKMHRLKQLSTKSEK